LEERSKKAFKFSIPYCYISFMHMLSNHNRSEFLACPGLIRFENAQGAEGYEPTLLIKASTLLLKYIVLGSALRICFSLVGDRLLYAVEVCDEGAILWSIMERQEELDAIRGLARGVQLRVCLFNEIAVNVAWHSSTLGPLNSRLNSWIDNAVIGPSDHNAMTELVSDRLDGLQSENQSNEKLLIIWLDGRNDWNALHNTFITNNLTSSLIDIFDEDEGNQQEQIGVWLTDNLQASGVHLRPRVPAGSGTRELTDIIFSHQFGAFFIESKVLSILARSHLPTRARLSLDVKKHLAKAFSQLKGGMKKVKSGVSVSSADGILIDVNRTNPAHAIVLVPDLDLINEPNAYDLSFIKDFFTATGAIPHILDISELLRVVQAAEMIAARGKTTTPIMAFDYYLTERLKVSVQKQTLCVEMLLRFTDDVEHA
jgi:hypothetical protein